MFVDAVDALRAEREGGAAEGEWGEYEEMAHGGEDEGAVEAAELREEGAGRASLSPREEDDDDAEY